MAAAASCVRHVGDELAVSVRVQPRAGSNEVLHVRNGQLLIRTTAAPADGKANKAVIRLLAAFLGVAPSRIRIVRGKSRRDKELRITGPVELPPSIVPGRGANGL